MSSRDNQSINQSINIRLFDVKVISQLSKRKFTKITLQNLHLENSEESEFKDLAELDGKRRNSVSK